MKNIIILASLFLTTNAMAQTLPKECTAYRPRVLKKIIIYQKDVQSISGGNWGQTGSTREYWDVYSDRCNNTLYFSPNTSSPNGKKLEFNQRVRIATIQNGFALVYKENKKGGVDYPQISGDKVCLGWVPMDHLLLWDKCPANDYGITRKALIVRNLSQNSAEMRSSLGKISQHPDVSVRDHTSYATASADFHYVMKTVGSGSNKRYLISRSDNLGDATSQLVLEGWISANTFTAWNQRSCLEPNWDIDDVTYFMDKSEMGNVYETASCSKAIQHWKYGQTNEEGESSTKYRFPPRAMRFPILDKKDNTDEEFRMTAFGTPNGEMGRQMIRQDQANDARERALKQTSQINIIVVIDGTRSMSKYFDTMSKAVRQATDYLEGEVKVGVVIYRDYADKQALIEYHKCAGANDASLQNFLKNVGRLGYGANSAPSDLTAHEAMYLGMKTAFDCGKMGYSPKNSNLVFVIGDCGNDPRDARSTKAQVIAAAKAANVQLFSFQVRNEDKPAWDDFNSQLTDIFMAQMKYLYFGQNVFWRPIPNGFRVDQGNNSKFYASEMHRAQVGKELSEAELTKMIQNSYKKFRNAIDIQLMKIASGGTMNQEGESTKSVSIDREFLKRKLGADYEATVQANALLAYEGYAKRRDAAEHDYWQPVVFMSSKELVNLNDKLAPLALAARQNSYTTESRKNYVDAVASIIHSMTEMSEAEIMAMRTDEITRIIGGLNVSTPMLKGKYTLSQIKNPSACPDEDYKSILKRMSTKIENLASLTKKKYTYSYEQNGTRYYWIPLNWIP